MGCQRDPSTQRTPSTTTACTAAVSHHSILLVRAIKGTQPLASPDLPHMRQKLRGTPGRGMRLSCGMAPPAGRQCCAKQRTQLQALWQSDNRRRTTHVWAAAIVWEL